MDDEDDGGGVRKKRRMQVLTYEEMMMGTVEEEKEWLAELTSRYVDDINGGPLDEEAVYAAEEEELKFVRSSRL